MRGFRRRAAALALSAAMLAALAPVASADDITKIHEIQGAGDSSPLVGETVAVRGVVVADLQHSGGWGGFYLQEEDADADGDPQTSEGIFVVSTTDVALGDVVKVSGRVAEGFGETQLRDVSISGGPNRPQLVTPTAVTFPVGAVSELERFEGMSVVFPQDLYITEFFNYDRFGEMVLATSRQYQGTHVSEPGAPANAVTAANHLARITLDDGLNTRGNPSVLRHPNGEAFALDNTFRGGDILQDVRGVLGFAFSRYRIHPTAGATHVAANPRPASPDPIDGDLRVASFNVLNFFTHIDDGSNTCGPTANLNCRGADTEAEYRRQLDKLVAGIQALDADVIGLQEIENDVRTDDGNRTHDAVLTLVEELNAADGPGTWAWVGDAGHYNNYPVRNEIIYRPAAVTPVGAPVALAAEAFDATRPGDIEPLGRPPLAQSFRANGEDESGGPFTVVVNHFKSKGSSCDSIGDPDTEDGQANCNLTRVAQAEALLDFVSELEQSSSGVLVIGDLNSYAMEDPITTLEQGGLIELVERYQGAAAYSYVFDGQLGYLDTALATRSMSNRVTGLTIFHINADEPDVLDYDMTFKPPEQEALYEANAYRSSDHDPVIIGLTFGGQ